MKNLIRATIFAVGVGTGTLGYSQNWPAQPIKIVVNFAPGGAADQLARVITPQLHEALKQPVIVENKTGAGGNLGGLQVAKSPADGYTLLMSSGGMISINPHIYPKMPFDPAKDLVPVASIARVPFYLVVRADGPIKDYKGLIAELKARPGKISFGSPGNGSSPHLAAEMLKSETGTFAVHVPYRGAAPALSDLLGGQIDFLFDPGIAIQHVKSGKLRMIAVGSPKRAPQMPDVPTLDELGLKGFDADAVFGLYAPAGTPQAVIDRLNAEVNRVLNSPATKAKIVALGNLPQPLTPREFGLKGAADSQRFGALIRARGIQGD
jgi:tripartite-type tricarboxylate transporter receptor subunit TctC